MTPHTHYRPRKRNTYIGESRLILIVGIGEGLMRIIGEGNETRIQAKVASYLIGYEHTRAKVAIAMPSSQGDRRHIIVAKCAHACKRVLFFSTHLSNTC